MAGYLDHYGAGEERREKIIKTVVISLVTILVVGSILVFMLYNVRQERQVKRFIGQLRAGQYQAAYELWVRTESDRKAYPMTSFMRDWGPGSGHSDLSGFRISKSRSCGSGVILTVDFDKGNQEKLWVEREALTIGFSPLPGCPAPR